MSRVAKAPITLPNGVTAHLTGNVISIVGKLGKLTTRLNESVSLEIGESSILTHPNPHYPNAIAQAGTARSILSNMVRGVSEGFERKLQIVGVGYRASLKGEVVNLSLGYSHPVEYKAPTGIVLEVPSQTEIVVKGCDKHLVGQVAANIRAYRQPEPYKGKGIRYSDEVILRKETKKK